MGKTEELLEEMKELVLEKLPAPGKLREFYGTLKKIPSYQNSKQRLLIRRYFIMKRDM